MKNIVMLFFVFAMSISFLIACTASDRPAAVGGAAKKEDVRMTTTAGQLKEQAAETVSAGEEMFMLHCVACHRDGGNIVNPQKTLHKHVREQNGIKTADDIIKIMRNPGPGMSTFNKTYVPDKDAKAIADYILKTF